MLLPIFCAATLVQLLFWALILPTAYRKRIPAAPVPEPEFPLSVIVCFRNEADYLAACLEGILAQDYPAGFEVVLVDDNSTDRSPEIALAYAGYDDRVRVVHPGPTRPGKKDALAYGIEKARYECMVLTDADCTPASHDWLRHLAAGLYGRHDLAIGVSPYRTSTTNPWLGAWQQFEAFYVSLKYLSFARLGSPYMGVGRNLAYTKGFYARAGGFEGHADLPSGDDDLLVSAGAQPWSTSTVTHPAAWVWSRPHGSFQQYLHQRARHQTTGVRYPCEISLLLGLLALSHGLFFLLGLFVLFTQPVLAISVYLGRATFVLLSFRRPYMQLGEAAGTGLRGKSALSWWGTVLLGDLLLGPMYLYLASSGRGRKKTW